ncbi:MAG: hypothetical protein WCD51_02015, partial [Anaerolineae bacterium]
MPTTLRSRLLASYILIIVICLAVTGVMLTLLLVPQVTRLTYLRLAEKALPTALRVLSLRSQGLSPAETLDALAARATADNTRLLIVSSDGRVLADSDGGWVDRTIDLPALQEGVDGTKVYLQGRLLTRE